MFYTLQIANLIEAHVVIIAYQNIIKSTSLTNNSKNTCDFIREQFNLEDLMTYVIFLK